MSNAQSNGQGKWALPSSVYDAAKDTALIYLPAVAVLYGALAAVWHWGFIAEVSATILAVDTFLGVVLKISTASYNNSSKSTDGTLIIDQSNPAKDSYVFDVATPLDEVAGADRITLKIDNQTPTAYTDPYLGRHVDPEKSQE
jgi:hypothetical protein